MAEWWELVAFLGASIVWSLMVALLVGAPRAKWLMLRALRGPEGAEVRKVLVEGPLLAAEARLTAAVGAQVSDGIRSVPMPQIDTAAIVAGVETSIKAEVAGAVSGLESRITEHLKASGLASVAAMAKRDKAWEREEAETYDAALRVSEEELMSQVESLLSIPEAVLGTKWASRQRALARKNPLGVLRALNKLKHYAAANGIEIPMEAQ